MRPYATAAPSTSAWQRVTVAFGVCLLWIGLWLASPSRHYTADREVVFAASGPGVLAQVASHRGALHLLLMRQDSGGPATLSFRRLTYLGNAGYHHSYGFDLLGVAFALLPYEIRGTDAPLDPYVAVVLPYWLLLAVTILLFWKGPSYLARLKRVRGKPQPPELPV